MRIELAAMSRAYRSRSYHAAWIGPVALVLLLGSWQPPFVSRLRDQVFDLYQRTAPRAFDPRAPVRIVDIDDRSIAAIGQWPWPRTKIAALVDRLTKAGAAAIAFDIVFSEPDRTSAEAFLAAMPDGARKRAVGTALAGTDSNDSVLARMLAPSPVVLGLVLTQSTSLPTFPAPYGLAAAGDDPKRFVPHFSGAVVPLPILVERSAGVGALNWLPDNDQIVRRVPLLLAGGDRLVPGLALESLRVAQGASTFIVRSSNASGDMAFGVHDGVETIRVGAVTVPTERTGDIRVRFTRHRPERFISAATVLDGSFDPAAVAGSIVIVGSSSAGLTDIRATPVDPAMPGVEVQAQAIEGLLSGSQLVRPDWARIELGAGILLAILLALGLPIVPPLAGASTALAFVAVLVATSWWAFAARQLLLDPIVPGAMVAAAYVGATSALFRAEQTDRRFVQDAFGRFVSPAVVSRLARDPSRLALGGELRALTVMFTDIRNFSTIAERMGPQDLTRFMNRYLSPMSEIVLAHGGTVDKYIGDAIMAFWNAPLPDADHAGHAAQAALGMLAALPALQNALRAEAEIDLPTIRCGIGLASGPCVVGNLGSRLRFDYSALGDDVNLASRLEGLTKTYGVDILATETTRRQAPRLAWIEVDRVVVMGRDAATTISTLLGDEATAATAAFRSMSAAHEAMLADYRARRFEAASAALAALEADAPSALVELYALYAERCRDHLAHPPDADWDAVTRMEHK